MILTGEYSFRLVLGLVAVFVASCLFAAAKPEQSAAQSSETVRFPVAHEHISGLGSHSWCLGYLYMDDDSIWYEVVRPAKDKKHEFKIKRAELVLVSRWRSYNVQTSAWDQKNAVELRFGKSVYHFWWLPDERQVQNGRPYEPDPSDAAAPDTLIAAIRDAASLQNPAPTQDAQPAPAAQGANPTIQPAGSAPNTPAAAMLSSSPQNSPVQSTVAYQPVTTGDSSSSSAGLSSTASQPQTDETRRNELERKLKAQAELQSKIAEALRNSNHPSQAGSGQPIASTEAPSMAEQQDAAFAHGTAAQSSPASAGQDAWRPDNQVGDLQFNVPKGWKQAQLPQGIVLIPNGISQNSVVLIGFLPAQAVGDPYSWFRAAWANWKTRINLIDSGAPETKRNPNGFEVLRSYSRAYSPQMGNATFIFAAAVAGNRVAPYFYLCNTNCGFDGYQNDFQTFELSLTLASLASSRPNPNANASGGSGGLKGLYTSYKMSEGDVALGTFKIRGSIVYLAFFPDGNVIRYLPKEGLENFDFRTAVRSSRESCGRYHFDGNHITITWGDNSTYAGVRDGAKLLIQDHVSHGLGGDYDSIGYEPTAHSDGLSLNGIYHPDRADIRARIAFLPDGRFADDGALTAADFPSSPGTGSYHIKDNTLTLSYSGGRTVKVSFFVSAGEEGSHSPGMIHVNGRALLKVN